ncbi:DUF397 domain-containing protein [Actinomadura sp. 9N407]|uniref:DUF397 domain-containing protein n=1 Tax=Actinomadura sp. 9N407 TaxID=3375154 RepID=UPI0037A77813
MISVGSPRSIWRKSSYSGNGQCIETAAVDGSVVVRDSKDPAGPVLVLGQQAWIDLISVLRRR